MSDWEENNDLGKISQNKTIWLMFKKIFEFNERKRKFSIAKCVITYSFIISLLLSIIVVINCWFFKNEEGMVPCIVEDIKGVWGILTPFITMTLGYVFGRTYKE